jgi:hypothetical protein
MTARPILKIIAASVVIIILAIFAYLTLTKNKKVAMVPTATPIKNTSNLKTHTLSEQGHNITFTYSPTYTVSTGGRPFNTNNEGVSNLALANCTSHALCTGSAENSFTVTIYENRQNWSLDDWMQKSVYAPQTQCKTKDTRANIQAQSYNNHPAYKFTYTSDKEGVKGCIELPDDYIQGQGEELIFTKDAQIIVVSEFSNLPELKSDLDNIRDTLKIDEE